MIIGESNRAKSFVLKALSCIFKTYVPPDSGTHQLADLKGSEILWLNEWEYDPSFMPWRKMKDFLEGSHVKVAVPKTSGKNYTFTGDAPVFATSPDKIRHHKDSETVQMDNRVRYFTFTHFFDPDHCPDIQPCAHCCARWYLVVAPN